jgi:hypothetical protein
MQMNWKMFQETAPELARLAEERFVRHRVVLLGTLHRDGAPRISPVEPLLAEGELLLGLLWHSTKALDLLRDPRCTLHTVVTDTQGTEGECKLDGRAIEAADPALQSKYRKIFRQHWAETTPECLHAFTLEVERAAFVIYDLGIGEKQVTSWDPEHGVKEIREPFP